MSRNLRGLREALVRILPDGGRITGIKAFSTGHSNETYLIEGLDQILRLPTSSDPLMPDCHGVIAQARILEALAQTEGAPTVPRILYRSDDVSVLGYPFFVMARVAGDEVNDYAPQPWFADAPPALRETMCETWMSAFGRLAGLAPLDVLGASISPEDEARRWRGWAAKADCQALVVQFDKLLSIQAPRTGTSSPVHGDPKLANLMWDKGELTAILDWELAFNGEPLSDLGYILFFFESDMHPANRGCGFPGMWKRDQIISHWAATTGRSTNGIEWHEVAAAVKMSAIIAYGYHLYVSGKSGDSRFLQWKIALERNLTLVDTMLQNM